MGLNEGRFGLNGLLVFSHGTSEVTLRLENRSQVAMCRRMVRIQTQRQTKLSSRIR